MAKKTTKKQAAKKRRGFRLLPLTVTMLSLLLLVKFNELYIQSQNLREFYGVREAVASAKKEEAPETKKAPNIGDELKKKTEGEKDPKPPEAFPKGDKSREVPGETITYGTGRSKIADIEAIKAHETKLQFTQNELDLLQNLSKRREELDQREKDFDLKSSVLAASEKHLSDKIAEMKALEAELKKVLTMYDEKQSMQIKSLVKVYENMKPADAANIFNEMQMPILLEVIDKMSERKVAPVLAAMDPKRARDVTQELAAMRRSMSEKMPSGGAGGAAKAPAKPRASKPKKASKPKAKASAGKVAKKAPKKAPAKKAAKSKK
jgi:flagellar motility protein MotE (MotC chaperone)